MIYVGCDPGFSGGIVALSGESEILFQYAINKGDEDLITFYGELGEVFGELKSKYMDIIFCIEDVHSLYGMSASSNFNFGGIKHAKIALSTMAGFDTKLVSVRNWQKAIWEPDDIVIVKGKNRYKNDTKTTSLNAAKRLWPDADLRKSNRAKKWHDGIVDAALIAEYCRIVELDSNK